MCEQVLQSCKVDISAKLGVSKVLELDAGRRKLIYGRGLRARIEVPTEQLDIPLKGLVADVLAALKLSSDSGPEHFITIDADHKLLIWSLDGLELDRMDQHEGPVLGLWELSDGCIASWGTEKSFFGWRRWLSENASALRPPWREDKSLLVWRRISTPGAAATKRSHVRRIPLSAHLFEEVPFVPAKAAVCAPAGYRSKRLIDLRTGKQRVKFSGQPEPLTAVRQLDSGKYITTQESGMKLRDTDGKLITRLPKFSYDEGYLAYSKHHTHAGHWQIVDELHGLHLMDASGARRGTRGPDEPMAKDLRRYFKSHAQTLKAIGGEPTLAQFGFRHNPLCDFAAVGDDGKSPPNNASKELWEFFHRPRNARIQSWLLAEVKAARDVQTLVAVADAQHQRRARFAQRLMRIAWRTLLASAAVVTFVNVLHFRASLGNDAWLLWSATLVTLVSIGVWTQMSNENSAMSSARAALAALPQHTADMLIEIERAKAQLRAALPSVVSPHLYYASCMRAAIAKATATLQRVAFDSVKDRVKASEVIATFVLRDWSLLARADSERESAHLQAFWWTPDGSVWLAVERIQVLLVTKYRLYLYRVDVDYITGAASNEERHVVYYDEVADVIIRDKQRAVTLSGVTSSVSAREMVIVSKGGETISLCALNETSFEALFAAAKATTTASLDTLRRNLDAEKQQCAPRHQARIEAERSTLDAETLSASPVDKNRGGVDDVFTQIKNVILGKSSPSRRVGSAWPKLRRTQVDLN